MSDTILAPEMKKRLLSLPPAQLVIIIDLLCAELAEYAEGVHTREWTEAGEEKSESVPGEEIALECLAEARSWAENHPAEAETNLGSSRQGLQPADAPVDAAGRRRL